MGCFNVSCALSGLTIHAGDPCYLIPLIPQDFRFDHSDNVIIRPDTMICSNEGSLAFYNIALLPLLGEYDDYGRLENPKSPENVKAIERIIGTDIESFLDNPSGFEIDAKVFEYSDKLNESRFNNRKVKLSGCFIHKFAYDVAVKHVLRTSSSYFKHFPVGNDLLEYMGLGTPIDNEAIDKRYHYLYIIKGEDRYAIQSDGQFSHISQKIDEVWTQYRSTHNMEELVKKWKAITGKTLSIPKEAAKKNIFNLVFDSNRDRFMKMAAMEDMKSDSSNDLEKKSRDLIDIIEFHELIMSANKRTNNLFVSYKKEVSEDVSEIRKLMCELNDLITFMFLNNRLFMPTSIGPQGGDLPAELSLIKASKDFIHKKEKQYDND